MGFGDFVRDITPDVVEDAVEDGVEWAGDRVEDAGNWAGDRLDDAGWESGANWVREKSRSVANRMGAEVDEMDLGQTEDKTKLVYGSPSEIRSTATHLRNLQGAFDKVGGGLKGVDSSALKGQAADAFRNSVSVEPPKWFKAADAFEKAAAALDAFVGTVEWAQGQAQTAIDKWKAGTKASEEARDAYNEKTTTYNKAVDAYNAKPADERDPSTLPPKPGTFSDPGTGRMKEAQELLAEARKQRNTAAETARKAVTAARDAAPQKPRYAEQAMDGLAEYQVIKTHLAGGVVKGAAGILTFARSVNPMDLYNITHPAEYGLALNNTAAGLVRVANDPWGTGKQMLDDFMKDPAEGFGRLLPDAALTVATGGAGAGVKGTRVVKEAADIASDARKLENRSPEGTHNRPDSERTSGGTDPVDLASGRMFLPQTDVRLPGVLPLTFTRRFESGYTAGRFFGPSWSSTVDERLEIDAHGVIHVTADGLLITYPHPLPGLPTHPESGTSRNSLSRDESGDYTLTDSDTRLTKYFSAPHGTEPGQDGTAWLFQITDRNDNAISIDRTDDGTPQELVHSAGYRLSLTSTETGITVLSVRDETGAAIPIRSYGYTCGDLTTVTKPSGATLTFIYDDRGRITAWIDSNNHRYDYTYDNSDRVIAQGGEGGHLQMTLAYSDPDTATGHRTTSLTTARGHTTRYLVGRGSHILSTTDPLGHTTRFTHDARGRLLTLTDPLGRATTHQYDGEGRQIAVLHPDGSEERIVFDQLGLPTQYTAQDGARWLQEFDDRGNRTAVTDPMGNTTRYTYDAAGFLTGKTDPLGAVTSIRCNASGQPVAVTDAVGATTRYQRDLLGRPVRITDALGATTVLEWSADGELAGRTTPDGSKESWAYDGEGNCTRHVDALGRESHFEYTHFDLLSASRSPDGASFEFQHDGELNLTQVRNTLGSVWSYTRDPAGRLVSETDFDGRTLTYESDAAGQVVTRTNPLGESITYERDACGRVTRKDAAGAVTTFSYDRAGRLLHAAGPESELLYQYNRIGRVKAEIADGRVTTYAYDALGRRTERMTPTGQRTRYAYDSSDRLTELISGSRTIAFTHDLAGRELTRAIGPELTFDSAWDDAGRLVAQHIFRGEDTVNRRSYTYDADDRLTAVDDTLRGMSRFTLDAAGRVVSVTADRWAENYAYDADGNQTSASWTASHPGQEATGPRSYTGTEIIHAGAIRFEHDALGRVTVRRKTRLSRSPDTWRYTWDVEDRLTSVTTPDDITWLYRYDPLGRRTSKVRLSDTGDPTGEEIRFSWDGTTLCEQTTLSPALPRPVTLTWDHDGIRPLAQTERILSSNTRQDVIDERFFAIATDLIGTPTELIDETGNVGWQSRATLWGSTTWPRDSTTYTPLRFPGQYYDPESGLHYNHHRHYDPQTARYLTADPLGLSPAPNPRTYVHNPHTWSDPLGLGPCPRGGWEEKADFSSQSVMSKKFHAHAGDFLDEPGNLKKANLQRFEDSMRAHIKADDTKIYRFDYRGQGQAIGFIDPTTQKMVMLHADTGKFWSGYKLGDKQFQSIIDKGFLW
ncbi:putative T7SS-secreted protein [Streptomyces parvus]|uniref:putative T7SS-secreted protein n=1 Tax=Streptomyces parvus TaxID=66428 RepID=UPI0033FDD2C5